MIQNLIINTIAFLQSFSAGFNMQQFLKKFNGEIYFQGNLKIGMVVETSEFTSSDDSSDDEDQVKPGDVRVAWYPAGAEEVLPEKKLHLADR